MIHPCQLPEQALLRKHSESGAYTDCCAVEIARSVSQAEYIEAFYTTWIFKLERLLLGLFVSRPSAAKSRLLGSRT